MQNPNNYICVLITPSGEYQSHTLTISGDENIAVLLTEQMNNLGCYLFTARVAKALVPEESYCFAFFQGKEESADYAYNPTATKIINNIYCLDNQELVTKCYGNCYIVHFDHFSQIHDLSPEGFVELYNVYHTSNGPIPRQNRINTESNESINNIESNESINNTESNESNSVSN